MILQRAAARIQRLRLGVHQFRRRSVNLAPVVKNLGHVMDGLGASGEPQRQIVILRAAEFRAKAAYFVEEVLADHQQMQQVHHRQEMVGRPVRLAEVVDKFAAVVELVFVGVEEVDFRIELDGFRHFVERFGRKLIVVVEHRHVVAGRDFHRAVGCGGDALILFMNHDLDARIDSAVAFQDL